MSVFIHQECYCIETRNCAVKVPGMLLHGHMECYCMGT